MLEKTQNYISALKIELLNGSSVALEYLASDLVGEAIGIPVRKAAGGSQSGGDAGVSSVTRVIRVETKRYQDTTSLSERELLGEVAQAFQKDPMLEAWILVTTREVPEQTASALNRFSEEHGAPTIILDWTGAVPLLAKLCASRPEIVRVRYGDTAAQAAEKLSKLTDVSKAIDVLGSELDQWSAGWEITSRRLKNTNTHVFFERTESKALFRQDISVAAPQSGLVQREGLVEQMDAWGLSNNASPLVIAGNEGRGKSWVLANWLYKHPDDGTSILFCSSSEIRGLKFHTIEELLSAVLSKRISEHSKAYWHKRIERLKQGNFITPPIWIIVDGLNEVPTADWAGLILDAQRDSWRAHIRLVVSCRTQYFESKLNGGRSWIYSPTVIKVSEYTNEERSLALASQNIASDTLSESVLKLASVPRICRLVARMYEQLKEVEYITYEQLLFEYGKRFDPDERHGLRDDVWHAFLRELALATQKGASAARWSQIKEWIDIQETESVEITLSDIVDGKLVKKVENEPGLIEFDRGLVLAANGLALWKLIEKKSNDDMENLIASELEPLGGLDERPRIVSATLAAALISGAADDVLSKVVSALVVEGITSQNLGEDEESSLMSYIRAFPSGYLGSLEKLLRLHRSSEADAVCISIQDVMEDGKVRDAVVEVAALWVSIVPLDLRMDKDLPDNQKYRTKEVIRWLGKIPNAGETSVLGVPILIEEESNYNLPNYAIRLVQHCPLAMCGEVWRRLGVSSVIRRGYTAYDAASWVVRLNNIDFDKAREVIYSEAEYLRTQTAPEGADVSLPKRAAANLYWLFEDDESHLKARDLVSVPDGWESSKEYIDAPNNSPFQLERCQIEKVLQESDQEVELLLRRAKKWWPDPELIVAEDFVDKSIEYVNSFDLSEVRIHLSHSKSDWEISELCSSMAKLSPKVLSELYSRMLGKLSGRFDEGWIRLAYSLDDMWLVASVEDSENARKELCRIDIDKSELRVESMADVVLCMLATRNCSPAEYVRYLIKFTDGSMTESTTSCFRKITTETADQMVDEINQFKDHNSDWVFLNLLSHTNTPISDYVGDYLIELLNSNWAGVRNLALFTLANSNNKSCSLKFAETGWSWKDVEGNSEQSNGSDILLFIQKSLPLSELLSRIAPWKLPLLAKGRTCQSELAIIAQTISAFLLSDNKIVRHPFKEIYDLTPSPFYKPHSKLRLEDSKQDETWLDNEKFRELQTAKNEAIKLIENERKNGLALYGVWVDQDSLSTLLDAVPSILKEWLCDIDNSGSRLVNNIRRAPGFYNALCRNLLHKNPELGVKLWRLIDKTPITTRFISHRYLDERESILFESPENEILYKLLDEQWDISRTASNYALSQLILVAEYGKKGYWIDKKISEDLNSSRAWKRYRGILASSFRISPSLDKESLHREPGLYGPTDRIKQKAAINSARGKWQAHWLREYCVAESLEDAFSAFILFLDVVDSRWPLILKRLGSEEVTMDEERSCYFNIRISDVNKAVEKQNDILKKEFLEDRICEKLWPWSK